MTLAYLAHNLCDYMQLRVATSVIEILAFTSAQFVMTHNIFLGFIVVYAFTQYITLTFMSLLPLFLQSSYLTFGLLALSYVIVDYLKANYSSDIEVYE